MKKFTVKGMSCTACASRVEKEVAKLQGVKSVSVNLLLNSMIVEGEADDQLIINAVKKAGYFAFVDDGIAKKVEKSQVVILRNRLLLSLGFLVLLMYLSMSKMLSLPLPLFLTKNPLIIAVLEMLLSLAVIIINVRFYVNGFKGLIKGAPNMDTLVSLGSFAGFIYSFVYVILMTIATLNNHLEVASSHLSELYFESSAMILALITLGKLLEAYSKGKTTSALKSLMALAPETATILFDGKEQTVLVEKVKKGDVFVVRPGESIPVDGVIIEGNTSVDESMLTGESIPVDKTIDDQVKAGTINEFGFIICRATSTCEDTSLNKIIQLVNDVSMTKAPIAKIADKVSGVFVPIVMCIALIAFVVWILITHSIGFSLARGISVLVISCPCALGLATPVAIMVGSGMGAKKGVLFKNAESLEQTGKATIIALDKTGTITKGKPVVTDIIPFEDFDEKSLLQLAYNLEVKSEHPLAKAVCKKGEESSLVASQITDFKIFPGGGLTAKLNGKEVYGGSFKFINNIIPISNLEIFEELASCGKTPLYFAVEGKIAGIIAVADEIREDSVYAIQLLKELGLKVVMLTGDNNKTANAISKAVGIDETYDSLLPENKAEILTELKKQGKVIMVGDGINDAPSLTIADIGMAIGQGTDVAINSADVVLMKNNLLSAVNAIILSKKTIKNIKENLFWAFIYNAICIPLACGVFIPLNITLNPMIGAAAMSLSSVCVVSNALRLNFFKEKALKTDNLLFIKVKGMMCGHCEKRVENALKKLPFVLSADANYKKGIVVLTFDKEYDLKKIKDCIKNENYKFIKLKENLND